MVRKEVIDKLEGYIEELKTVKVEPTNEDPEFLKIERSIYYLNNGKQIKRERLQKGNNNGCAVIVVPITKTGKTVLTVEPRIGSKRSVGLGIPAGYINPEEEPVEAAKRELCEETGYVCDQYILLAQYFQDSGISKAYNYAYLGLGATKTTTQSLDPGEFVRYLECTFEEALELIELGYIEGLQVQYALEKAKSYIKK